MTPVSGTIFPPKSKSVERMDLCICKIYKFKKIILKFAGKLNAHKTWKIAVVPGPLGAPQTLPILNLISDSYLGGEIVQEIWFTFDATIPNTVTMMPQSWIKYDQFFKQYASRMLQPIYDYLFLWGWWPVQGLGHKAPKLSEIGPLALLSGWTAAA